MKTDKERLDWLEKQGHGVALIHNDCHHWAVAYDGMQNMPPDDSGDAFDTETSYWIEKEWFAPTIRGAIDLAIALQECE